MVIRYVPGERCVETKSLKFYLASFRNQPAFNEEIVNRILDDLVRATRLRRMEIEGDFYVRVGIHTVVRAAHEGPKRGGKASVSGRPRSSRTC